jgi:hypothetical protein
MQTPLILALRDPHVQELLLKETSNTKAAVREKDKLAQMEKDKKNSVVSWVPARVYTPERNPQSFGDEGATQMDRRELR